MEKVVRTVDADQLNLLTTDILELISDKTGIEDNNCDLWKEINNILNKFFHYPEYDNYN